MACCLTRALAAVRAEEVRRARHSYFGRTARLLCCGTTAQAHRYAAFPRLVP